ncbi:MAG: hypothetical protein F6K58_08360 [Symploca sp. SIO2E9]|nr:hypothetical protein [Symploca sp. SIO2E9]
MRLNLMIRKVIKNIKYHITNVRWEIAGLLRDCKNHLQQPVNEFSLQGYEIIQNFLDQDECDRLIELANHYLRDQSYLIYGNCYLVCRNAVQEVDSKVQQLMNVQEVDTQLSQLFHSHKIEELFEQRIGQKLRLKTISIQVDNLDTESKRGFHNDNITPPGFKAFIYLNDVADYGDGPYTIIPGSHRHTFRKIINHLYNRLITVLSRRKNYPVGDMRLFYSDKQSVSIFGKAGTLILSNQQLAHKGWQKHDQNKRYVLVCYLKLEKFDNGELFNLGQKAILQTA